MRLRRLRLCNFLSYRDEGADLTFEGPGVWLVYGINHDVPPRNGGVVRNGAGKSALLHAVRYALFGAPPGSGVRLPHLVNSRSGRAMRVFAMFDTGGSTLEIERGRNPEFVSWRILLEDGDVPASASGTSDAAAALAERLSFDRRTFAAVAATDAAAPTVFTAGAPERRAILGPVLGLDAFDRRADVFRRMASEMDARLRDLEVERRARSETARRIAGEARRRLSTLVDRLHRLDAEIARLAEIDPEEEIRRHRANAELAELEARRRDLRREARPLIAERDSLERALRECTRDLDRIEADVCPNCGANIGDPEGRRRRAIEERMSELRERIADIDRRAAAIVAKEEEIAAAIARTADGGRPYDVATRNVEEAVAVRERLASSRTERERIAAAVAEERERADADGTEECLRGIGESIAEVERDLSAVRLLIRLLTKDDSPARRSFVRTRVRAIRERMDAILGDLGFDGRVDLRDDFSLDTWGCSARSYGTLSRGERARVDLAWRLALHAETLPAHGIRTLLLDEELDEGMDAEGLLRAWPVLIRHAVETRSVILVASNREELIGTAVRQVVVERRAGTSHARMVENRGG